MTMTREQAIKSYVENLSGSELVELIQYMNAYDGCFEDVIYHDMNAFDEILDGYTPLEIAQMIYFGEFNPNEDYFHFNAYGNLESGGWCDVEAAAEDVKDDLIDHLVHYYSGDTPWSELDDLVDADEDAIFDEDYEEVDADEEQ